MNRSSVVVIVEVRIHPHAMGAARGVSRYHSREGGPFRIHPAPWVLWGGIHPHAVGARGQ